LFYIFFPELPGCQCAMLVEWTFDCCHEGAKIRRTCGARNEWTEKKSANKSITRW